MCKGCVKVLNEAMIIRIISFSICVSNKVLNSPDVGSDRCLPCHQVIGNTQVPSQPVIACKFQAQINRRLRVLYLLIGDLHDFLCVQHIVFNAVANLFCRLFRQIQCQRFHPCPFLSDIPLISAELSPRTALRKSLLTLHLYVPSSFRFQED